MAAGGNRHNLAQELFTLNPIGAAKPQGARDKKLQGGRGKNQAGTWRRKESWRADGADPEDPGAAFVPRNPERHIPQNPARWDGGMNQDGVYGGYGRWAREARQGWEERDEILDVRTQRDRGSRNGNGNGNGLTHRGGQRRFDAGTNQDVRGGRNEGQPGGGRNEGQPRGERNDRQPRGGRNEGQPRGERNERQPRGGRNEGQPRGGRNEGQPRDDRNEGQPRRTYIPSYTKLLELSKMSSSDVLTTIANSHNGFLDLIAGQLRPDMIVLVVKVLSKACESDFRQNKGRLLSSVCTSPGFLTQVASHASGVYLETDRRKREGVEEFFRDLYLCLETVIDLLPTTACECLRTVLPLVQVGLTTANEFQGDSFSGSLMKKPTELNSKLRVIVDEKQTKPPSHSSQFTEQLAYQPPPDNFRDLSIFPTPQDILSRHQAFVRPNIVSGAYQDVDHYLDVQFRLLREDFVQPLREGIMQFVDQSVHPSKKKINNIRVYKKVRFDKVEVVMNNMGLVVVFEQGKSKVRWEYSKRFMFGSLLCFTQDNFQTVFFATVLNRDVKQLEAGRVVVQLSAGSEMFDDMFQSEYLMVESEVYFEPYYHVLKALQRMRPRDFPMGEYIVKVQAYSNPPQYVWIAPHYRYNIGTGQSVLVMEDRTWPTAAQLDLDDSQYTAFRAALTKEFVVIQGPPGTGKTYLGLKIARALLKNVKQLLKTTVLPARAALEGVQSDPDSSSDDDPDDPVRRPSPILVVCFTNHALDQFLEGLVTQTQSIVRVGGQSKSETLKAFNLREQRRRHVPGRNVTNLSRDIRTRMNKYMTRIKGIQQDMEQVDGGGGIVAISCIAEVFKHPSLAHLNGDGGNLSERQMVAWLLEGLDGFAAPPAGGPAEAEAARNSPENQPTLDMDEGRGDELWQRAPLDDLDLDRDLPAEVLLSYAINFSVQEKKIAETREEVERLNQPAMQGNFPLFDRTYELQEECDVLVRELAYMRHMLRGRRPQDAARVNLLLAANVNLWQMSAADRWALYRHWVALLRRSLEEELRRMELLYRDEAKQYEEAKQMEDLEMMRGVDVVGMTTTGAARLQTLLQALKSRIVIVEEAAEVMESHIIVSLTSHCQHLILIGDHEQLRPTTAVYKLARDYHFDISLFERMLKNGLNCEMLKVQHRMRPEIARLIVPSIYSELLNHSSVLEFPAVRGVTKSLFFLHHTNPETEVSETNSRSNQFEADTLLALCRHLLLQGYPPDRITLLTTYSGQMFYLKKEKARYPTLFNVKMTIVDNFQGEENDIIILSLVRNNKENNVGFLKIKNRVCVALSRAKHGMYIMGNMDNLTAHSESVWPQIKAALVKQDAFGSELVLRCQIHPNQLTPVKSAADFHKVPEGGCRLPCEADLVCGHRCKSLCHANNRDHKEYQCYEPCTRIPPECGLEHVCQKVCGLECGQCEVAVRRELPACDHVIMLPCHVDHTKYLCKVKVQVRNELCGHSYEKPCHHDEKTFPCPFPCENRVPCGHSCKLKCHAGEDVDHLKYKCVQPCAKKNAGCRKNHTCARKCHEACGACMVEVSVQPPDCDHLYKLACSADPAQIVCGRPCKRYLACGHQCRKKCEERCGECNVKVKKRVPECQHEVSIKCSEAAERRHCNGACPRKMACGHGCVRSCKAECSPRADCTVLVRSSVQPECGHVVQVPCKLQLKNLLPDSPELLAHCKERCPAVLKCGHPCAGSCGECLQGRVHLGCQAKCGRNLVCGHECRVACAESCPPCGAKCSFKCQHSRCNQKCGFPCKPCKDPCAWGCEHSSCTRLCGQECNRRPCYEACKRRLPCGHPCIGFCGEPCPPLCRVCDEQEVTTVFFGNEDEPDARFVYLVDCKHTLESEGLEGWLGVAKEAVTMPECPQCKTPIMKTLRYMNQIKVVLRDVCKIKKKVFGDQPAINAKREEMLLRVAALSVSSGVASSSTCTELLAKLNAWVQPVRNSQLNQLSLMDLETISMQLAILEEVVQVCKECADKVSGASLSTLNSHADLLLSAVVKRDRMSDQEMDDFNLELQRLQRIAHFCQLRTLMRQQPPNSRADALKVKARRLIFTLAKYARDDEVTKTLKEWSTVVNCVLTEAERKSIVAAMGFEKGHWFKCPNGHYYNIGDCGGATVISRCPECKAEIGGTGHRLLDTNRIATEMDGATMSAYDMNARLYRP